MTTLDVTKNTVLNTLDILYNNLTGIDLSQNTQLQTFQCEFNQLTSLDLSKNTTIAFVQAANNALTSLDVRPNNALTYVGCADNPDLPYICVNLSQDTQNWDKDNPAEWSTTCALTTAIEEYKVNSGIKIYPNPTSDFIVSSEYLEEVNIYNAQGELVMQSSGNKIDVRSLPIGIYLMRSKDFVYRFVKEN